MRAIEEAIEAIRSIDLQALHYEVKVLRAIKDWAMQQLNVDYKPGDRVVIVSNGPSGVGGGWAGYSEALAPGQMGVAGEIGFNTHSGRWYVMVGLDRSWETSHNHDGMATRYWNGPAAETPPGFKPPSAFDQERNPEGRVKWFAMQLGWVRKIDVSEVTE
jgi:hypothetical protein